MNTPPPEFNIDLSGSVCRYYQWIGLMSKGSLLEATTTIDATAVGVQFWGNQNDGWARVLADGTEVWKGDTFGADGYWPGRAFAKYLEVSGLAVGKHTIRVENLGQTGAGGGSDMTIYFFGLRGSAATSTPQAPSAAPGLVAYYPFDGDTRDYSGNGNNGTAKGSLTYASGAVGQGRWRPHCGWPASHRPLKLSASPPGPVKATRMELVSQPQGG